MIHLVLSLVNWHLHSFHSQSDLSDWLLIIIFSLMLNLVDWGTWMWLLCNCGFVKGSNPHSVLKSHIRWKSWRPTKRHHENVALEKPLASTPPLEQDVELMQVNIYKAVTHQLLPPEAGFHFDFFIFLLYQTSCCSRLCLDVFGLWSHDNPLNAMQGQYGLSCPYCWNLRWSYWVRFHLLMSFFNCIPWDHVQLA